VCVCLGVSVCVGRFVVGSRRANVVCITVLTGNRLG